MKKVLIFITIFFVVGVIPCAALATDDTDIYAIAEGAEPNVLIIFDNSGSMADSVPYVDTTTYGGTYVTDRIYERQCTRWWWMYCLRWEWVLLPEGTTIVDTNLDGIDDDDYWMRKGNRLNYENTPSEVKISIAKEAIKDVIDQTWEHVRFGIMVLNGDYDKNDGGTPYSAYHTDTSVLDPANGGAPIATRDAAGIEDLKDYIGVQTANGYTPLANRLINAADYFKGDFGSYSSPIEPVYWCRKNYVILMTDGLPTAEGNSRSDSDDSYGEFDFIEDWLEGKGVAADCDGDGNDPNGAAYATGGSDYLDDVAKYLYETEDCVDPTPSGVPVEGNQNLTIYTIGFTVEHDLLRETAETNGGGKYYIADSADELSQALIDTLVAIIERNQTFTAPVVPVHRTTSGDVMYVSLFTPKSLENFWPGYLIKLGIGNEGRLMGFNDAYGVDGGTTEVVVADDVTGELHEDLVDPTRPPYPYWDAHHTLKTRTSARNIYTYTGISSDLNHVSNAFVETNNQITLALLGTPTAGSNPREDLINYIHGADAYDEDGDTDYTEKRDNILGDILHSQPLAIDYSSTERVVFVGTNDGMLHAFNDANGSELWAFIPPDLLSRLKNIIEGTNHQYYVDGSPEAYTLDGNNDGDFLDVGTDKVIIVFGERRGGTSYCALDVTDPDDPQYLWRIDNMVTGFEELGQSWSEPQIGKVKAGAEGSETDEIVAIIGGGYSPDNSAGRALYVIDVLTGALVKTFTVSNHANMTYSIPSTVLAVDTTFDNYINRVYVGDLGGQMWRFGLHRDNSDDHRAENGNVDNWTPRLLFATNSASPIFYAPDLVLEPGYAYLYFGTGDRTNPCTTTGTNRFFAVKDRNENNVDFASRVGAEGKLIEDDLVDLTENLIQDGTAEQATQTLTDLTNYDGWYITMEGTGEKVLASPVVIFGIVFFTTFVPNSGPCSYGGDAYLYAVDYLNATAVLDFDEENEGLHKSDRTLAIGHGIPTEAVITIDAAGDTVVYVGVGGGVFRLAGPETDDNFAIGSWREVF
jgi:type IV pilus assembly protein PilY1